MCSCQLSQDNRRGLGSPVTGLEWAYASVLMLLDKGPEADPVATIEHRASEIELSAMEDG